MLGTQAALLWVDFYSSLIVDCKLHMTAWQSHILTQRSLIDDINPEDKLTLSAFHLKMIIHMK